MSLAKSMIEIPIHETSHSAMLQNTRQALDVLLVDRDKQQEALSKIEAHLAAQEEKLEHNQITRGELLAELQAAQTHASKCEAARDLSVSTPNEAEQEQRYTEARAGVSAIHGVLQAIAESDMSVRADAEQVKSLCEKATHALDRITERVSWATSIYNETLFAHREEVKQKHLAALTLARAHREKAKAQLERVEALAVKAQTLLANSLQEWPTYAIETLQKVAEVSDDEATKLLSDHLNVCLQSEEHARDFSPEAAKLLSIQTPTVYMASFGNRAAQVEHSRQTLKSPGRGMDPLLWEYDTAMQELEQAVAQSRAEHKRKVLEGLIYDHEGML